MQTITPITQQDELSDVLTILSEVNKHIDVTLTKEVHQHHKIRIMADLQRLIDHISLVTGQGLQPAPKPTDFPPASTIAGQKIRFTGKKKDFDVTPEESAVLDLKGRVDMIYPSFLSMDSKDIRKNVDEKVIRGVARKAKMEGITRDNPAIIDVDFINQVKLRIASNEQFIREQEERRQAQADQEVNDAFSGGSKATSEDAPESVGDIEKLQDEKKQAETTATQPLPGQPLLTPEDAVVNPSIQPTVTGDGSGRALPPADITLTDQEKKDQTEQQEKASKGKRKGK